jgi:hypothetical protein
MRPQPTLLPDRDPGPSTDYPWVHALRVAQQRLSRLKVGVAAAGAFLLGLIAAVVAGQSVVASPASPAAAATPGVDIFGQSTAPGPDLQLGPDNQPQTNDPGLLPGDNGGQGAPPIVTAPS